MKHSVGSEFNLPPETCNRLESYVDILLAWNQRINLIGRADTAIVWRRHVADSLQLLPLIPRNVPRAIDLGSGGGLPGLVLAIASGIDFDLIESDQRKSAFLREAARATGAAVKVITARMENATVAPAALVTARALAPLPQLLDLAHRFIAPGGLALFPKGANADEELTDAKATWNMRVERFPSRTHPDGAIFRLSEVERA